MQEVIKLLIGTVILILGYPIGRTLRRLTKDEQEVGRPWFIFLTWFSLVAGFTGLLLKKDWLLFTGFFITIVTSQSLRK